MSLASLFLDALYPRHLSCDLCGKDVVLEEAGLGAYLCPECCKQLVKAPYRPAPASLDGVEAGLVYNDEAAALIHRFKYGHCQYLAETLSYFLPQKLEVDCIVPVPLHPARLRQRGYNQSLLLAQELGKRDGLPVEEDRLVRMRNTTSQTFLESEARFRNMQDAFAGTGRIRGRRILLVDDVITTGATLNACAIALREKGAKAVWAVTVCTATQ